MRHPKRRNARLDQAATRRCRRRFRHYRRGLLRGSNDGVLRAYSITDGSILWEYDTNRGFETVNQVFAKGASIIGPGPVVVGGMLYVNSGYGAYGGRPGNVLLAFGVE